MSGANACRTQHRPQITLHQVGRARIQEQQAPNITPRYAGINQAHRWQPQSLVEYLGGARIVASSRATTDVRLVRPVGAKPDQLFVNEYRSRNNPIGQMVAARSIGIVEHEYIIVRDVVAERLDQGTDREPAAAGMDR